MEEKDISQAVIGRLPRYYRYLKELKDAGKERISSQELSRIMKVTASQIRQDFNNFGGFGQQGYGYNTNYLYDEIGKILGLDHTHNMVLVGAGNLGQALVRYLKFKQSGFNFVCAFDINPQLFGQTVGGIPIRPLSDLQEYVDANNVDGLISGISLTGSYISSSSMLKMILRFLRGFFPFSVRNLFLIGNYDFL